MSEVLLDSLKEQPLLLSISQDPSSTLKINKCLCTVLFKKYKGERRERLPTQRGEACNSTGVRSRLASSGEMCLFLCDFVGVLSRPASSGATPDLKNYTLEFFNSQDKLPFLISKHYDQVETFVVFD